MNVRRVGPRSAFLFDRCSACERKIQLEDWIIEQRLVDTAGGTVRFTAHADCVRTALASVPDRTAEAAARAREELIAMRAEFA